MRQWLLYTISLISMLVSAAGLIPLSPFSVNPALPPLPALTSPNIHTHLNLASTPTAKGVNISYSKSPNRCRVLIRSCVLVFSDSPDGERRPRFMMPQGATSTKMVLRGETLELECIADGL